MGKRVGAWFATSLPHLQIVPMALAQHESFDIRFQQQVENAENYLIPFIEKAQAVRPGLRVMEIGCGEGGVLKPFVAKGAQCLGVDLSESRINNAKKFMA